MVYPVPGGHRKVNAVSVLNWPRDIAPDETEKQCAPARGMDTMRRPGFCHTVQSSSTVAKPFAISDLTSGG